MNRPSTGPVSMPNNVSAACIIHRHTSHIDCLFVSFFLSLFIYFIYLLLIFMSSPPDNVSEGIMFSGCPSTAFVRSFVHSSGQILLPRYFMNALNNFDKTDADELIRFWRSKVKGQSYSGALR